MSTISNAASSATSTVTNFFSSALNRVGQFAGRIWTMMTNIVPSAVSSKVSKLFAPVTNVVKSMPKPIKAVVIAGAMCGVGALAYRFFKPKQNATSQPSVNEGQRQIPEDSSVENTEQNQGVALSTAPVSEADRRDSEGLIDQPQLGQSESGSAVATEVLAGQSESDDE
ncbi:MAG: hypothetical protein FJZ62_03280 [Chlamydiae bacterium]|nr:hypothetical protein [Chlamydiota bacterium]